MNTNEPSENTAELSAATYLSPVGTTLPRYCFTSSGWSLMASDMEQKMTPFSASSLRKVVPTETESNTASTATPASLARSCNRSEEHTAELQSLIRISYAVFCSKKKTINPLLLSLQKIYQ